MPAQVAVTIVDEIPGRGRREVVTLRLVSERITAAALIERRVRHEVEQLATPRELDADEQIAIARDAFEHGRVLLLVNDRQLEKLDDEVTLTGSTEVCFYQLVPLIGG